MIAIWKRNASPTVSTVRGHAHAGHGSAGLHASLNGGRPVSDATAQRLLFKLRWPPLWVPGKRLKALRHTLAAHRMLTALRTSQPSFAFFVLVHRLEKPEPEMPGSIDEGFVKGLHEQCAQTESLWLIWDYFLLVLR